MIDDDMDIRDESDTLDRDVRTHVITAMLAEYERLPFRQGLEDTPRRVAKALDEWLSGYKVDPNRLIVLFQDGTPVGASELIVVSNIRFFSMCVVGSTFVETPQGRIPISYLKDGDWVYTVDPDTLELGLVKCKAPRCTRENAKLVRVYTDQDTVLCTPDHKFLLYGKGWVRADELTSDDRVVSLYRGVIQGGYPKLVIGQPGHRKDTTKHLAYLGDKGGIAEHQFVAEQVFGFSGRHGRGQRATHHRDDQRWNNDPSNLATLPMSEHNAAHDKLVLARTPGTLEFEKRRQAAALASGRQETRERRAASVHEYHENRKALHLPGPPGYTAEMRARPTLVRNHIVLGVETMSQREDVWCMDVPVTQTFFANGMAVHNCEHHMAPFFGVAHVGYLPNKSVIGLSKIVRIVDAYARRLQVQERLTNQVVDLISDGLHAHAAGCVIHARHLCMESRGVRQPGTITTTSALRGALKTNPELRAEFYSLVPNPQGVVL